MTYDEALADFGDDFKAKTEGARVTATFELRDGHWYRVFSRGATPTPPDLRAAVERIAFLLDQSGGDRYAIEARGIARAVLNSDEGPDTQDSDG